MLQAARHDALRLDDRFMSEGISYSAKPDRGESVEEVEKIVAQLDIWLHMYRSEQYHYLLPGVTDAELQDFEAKIGFPLSEDFKAFYRWHNGEAEDDNDGIFGSYASFFCLEDILKYKNEFDEAERQNTWPISDRSIEEVWNSNWIPFYNHLDTVYCIDTEGGFEGISGQIVCHRIEGPYHSYIKIESPSFISFLRSFLKALKGTDGNFLRPSDDSSGPDLLMFDSPDAPMYPRYYPDEQQQKQ